MSVVINRTNLRRFKENLEDDFIRMKARMTPEELAKYMAEQKKSVEDVNKFSAILALVCIIVFGVIIIWVVAAFS